MQEDRLTRIERTYNDIEAKLLLGLKNNERLVSISLTYNDLLRVVIEKTCEHSYNENNVCVFCGNKE